MSGERKESIFLIDLNLENCDLQIYGNSWQYSDLWHMSGDSIPSGDQESGVIGANHQDKGPQVPN